MATISKLIRDTKTFVPRYWTTKSGEKIVVGFRVVSLGRMIAENAAEQERADRALGRRSRAKARENAVAKARMQSMKLQARNARIEKAARFYLETLDERTIAAIVRQLQQRKPNLCAGLSTPQLRRIVARVKRSSR